MPPCQHSPPRTVALLSSSSRAYGVLSRVMLPNPAAASGIPVHTSTPRSKPGLHSVLDRYLRSSRST
ncbi:hypothetical protein IF1G_10605 [Cordyceps javanica]|uniref:Uncharacterized protein n=1 Tax=Cordyceps javanica TaxID=43265 RepID=A0A545UMH3_9HYPO|nr:hypothetical protein IF1G_10605 [Cordyceps javanica]